MLLISNKYYNNKNKRKRDRINKKYLKIQSKRLSEEEKKPLNDHEKYLFGVEQFAFEPIKLSNGFYKFNGTSHITMPISKSEILSVYNSSVKILIDNPAKTIFSTIIDESIKNKLLRISENSKTASWFRICVISPKLDYVDFIEVSLFNLSTTYIGVVFDIIWNKEFINEINELITSQEIKRQKFKFILVNGRKIVTKGGTNPDNERRRRVDDILLEYKLKAYNFLSKYYKLEDCYKKMPLSLDEYITNLDIEDRFVLSQEYSPFVSKNNSFEISISTGENYVKKKCFFELFENNVFEMDYRINRSRLLIQTSDESKIHISLDKLITIYLTMIKKYSLLEYDNLLMKKYEIVNKSYKFFPTILFHGYKKYLSITNKTNVINSIIEDDKIDYKSLFELNFNFYDNNIKELYDTYSRREKEIDSQINNILNIRSNRVALYIAFTSLLVAVIAIIITIILSNGCK